MRDGAGPAVSQVMWTDGWLRRAARCESPNRNPRPPGAAVSLALIHSISLPPGEYGGEAIERLFTNRLDWDAHPYYGQIRGLKVSSHFLLCRNGGLRQFVSCDERAWHAGASVWRGRADCNDYSIGIELEGLEGGPFEIAQYEGLTRLLVDLALRFGVMDVAGHEHVAPGRKQDPGAGFEWARLIEALRWPDQCFPSGTLGQD